MILCPKCGKVEEYGIKEYVHRVGIFDENKSNNNAENLEWCTRQYNNNYGHRNEKISIARQRQERERKGEE